MRGYKFFAPKIHSIAAMFLGWVLVLQGLTGTMLAFTNEIDKFINPQIIASKISNEQFAKLIFEFEKTHGNTIATGISSLSDDNRLITAFWSESNQIVKSEKIYYLSRITPQSGSFSEPLKYGKMYFNKSGLLITIHAIHTNLTLGVIGKFFLILSSIAFLIILLSGLRSVYLRSRALSKKDINQINDSINGKIHRRVGIFVSSLLGMLIISGAMLQIETFIDPSFSIKSKENGTGQIIGLSKAFSIASQNHEQDTPKLAMSPFSPGGAYRVDFAEKFSGNIVEVYVDAYSGETIKNNKENLFTKKLISFAENLHGGKILGQIGNYLAAILGIIPLLMLITGLKHRKYKKMQ